MYDEGDVTDENEHISDMFDSHDENEGEESLVDYFNARSFKEVNSDHDTPFRKWHSDEDVKEMNIRIMEC
ncbi:MAG: hypothetical protein OCC49_11715 [Fibrobacterales bacterium]